MIYFAHWRSTNKRSSSGALNTREFDASLSMWTSMAYFVGHELNIDPFYIYTNWSCSHLLVVWGYFANIKAREAYEMWKNDTSEKRGKKPSEYAALFVTPQYVESIEEDSEKSDSDIDKLLSSLYENN